MNRAAIYVRVSTTAQSDDGTSLGTQESACRSYAEERGLAIDEGAVYREIHTGGQIWERPELTRLREKMHRREVDAVVCYSVDRLSRSQIHLGLLLSEADRAGVEMHFVTEPLERTAVGIFLQSARAFAAELEREKIRERSMRGKRARIAAGKVFGYGFAPYGYRVDKERGVRIVVEHEAAIVRDLYTWVAEGAVGMREACRRLNDAGILPPSTGKIVFKDDHRPAWQPGQLARLIRNPVYKGEGYALRYTANHTTAGAPKMRPREEWIALGPETTPAIVDAETWDKAQRRLDTNSGERARNQRHPMLLRGFVYCATCGKRMAVQAPGGPKSPHYKYRCTSRHNDIGGRFCGGRSIVAEPLERDVWGRVATVLMRPDVVGSDKKKLPADRGAERRRAAIERELRAIEGKQRRLLDRFADGDDGPDFPWELVKAKVGELQKRRERLADDLTMLNATPVPAPAADAPLALLLARVAANLPALTLEQRRAVLDVLALRVEGNGNEWRVWSDRLGREL